MDAYILTESGFCGLHEGGVQWLTMDEFVSSGLGRRGELAILLGGVEYRQVDPGRQERTGRMALPGGFIVRQERQRADTGLLMGVREDLLRALYQVVPRGAVKVSVPYGLAVRSYLISRGIELEGALHIVVDDAGERVFITVIDGMMLVETRELVLQDGERLLDEVKRSEKRLLERTNADRPLKLVSNHRAFLEAAYKQRRAEDILAVDAVLPVFEVLNKARFGVFFPSPAEELSKQQQEGWRRGALRHALLLSITAGVVVFAMFMSTMVRNDLTRRGLLTQEADRLKDALKERIALTCLNRIAQAKDINWEESFIDLIDSLPPGWKMQSILWEAGLDKAGRVTALVYQDGPGQFEAKGIYKNAVLANELTSGRPALKIVYQGTMTK